MVTSEVNTAAGIMVIVVVMGDEDFMVIDTCMVGGDITVAIGGPGGAFISAGVDRDGGGHGRCHLATTRRHRSLFSSSPRYMFNRNRSNPNTGTTARIPRDIIPTSKAARVDGCA
jgi:hypothetical protein